jgi:hypothetical protein
MASPEFRKGEFGGEGSMFHTPKWLTTDTRISDIGSVGVRTALGDKGEFRFNPLKHTGNYIYQLL